MPGANLPELTREITSIPRDASEYPRRPMEIVLVRRCPELDSLLDLGLEMQQCDFETAFVFERVNMLDLHLYGLIYMYIK